VDECKPLPTGRSWLLLRTAVQERKRTNTGGRGLHSSTSQLNLSRVCHKKTPYTTQTPPNTPLTRATQPLRTPPIPYTALKLS